MKHIVSSYQQALVDQLLGWNDLDYMFHKHMVQYLSDEHMNDMESLSQEIINLLVDRQIKSDQVLNIGTGIGLLESVGKINDYNFDCTEIKFLSANSQKLVNDFDPYALVRKTLGSSVTYWSNSIFDDNFIIQNCLNHYKYGLLIRYTPLTQDCKTEKDYSIIFNNLQRYVDNVIVIDDKRKVPEFLHKCATATLDNSFVVFDININKILSEIDPNLKYYK